MPTPGFFELYPEARPALPAGAYLFAADHDLVATPPHTATGALAVDGSDFTLKIISPRYTMPPDQVLSTFPPASAVGDWRERLPQIVFKRRTLPWERNPDPAVAFEDAPPWLALVVLAEGEGTVSPEVEVAQCVTPPRVLTGDGDTARGRYLQVRKSIVQKIFPTVEDLHLLTHVRKVDLSDTELALGDDDGYLAVVVANRLPQPGLPPEPGDDPAPVRYTAYVVNLEGQLDLLPTKEESESVNDFLVSMPELVATELLARPPDVPVDVMVMQGLPALFDVGGPKGAGSADGGAADRALPGPAAGASVSSFGAPRGVEAASSAFAVGPARAGALSADDTRGARQWVTGQPLGELAEVADKIGVVFAEPSYRFPVLLSWDFVCTGTGGFERLMNLLDSGMLGTVDEASDPALRPEIAATGHIALDHRSRRGEATRSWYRGPLVPQPTVRTQPGPGGTLPLAHTGDQLRRVVPDGHEDVGLAAAFEIGRLLALSKPGVVAALTAWREELFGAARASAIGRELADGLLAGFSDALVMGKRPLDDLLASTLLIPYAERVPDAVGPRARDFAASRVPAQIADLDPVMTVAGFGLDAGEVAQAVSTLGLAGLGTVDVKVAAVPSGPLSQAPGELEVLRGMADAHLDRLTIEALKLTVTAVKGRGRAAPPVEGDEEDDLDRLLDEAARRAEVAGEVDENPREDD
ncbi:MAG TPA: hypothetical protein VFO65_08555 [Acidimicrobiales bacterium]|nr:hypothetical protein [Acidimicrobiales bacterium]